MKTVNLENKEIDLLIRAIKYTHTNVTTRGLIEGLSEGDRNGLNALLVLRKKLEAFHHKCSCGKVVNDSELVDHGDGLLRCPHCGCH